jgi:hypothetical protein
MAGRRNAITCYSLNVVWPIVKWTCVAVSCNAIAERVSAANPTKEMHVLNFKWCSLWYSNLIIV